jgi:hypothetical protein
VDRHRFRSDRHRFNDSVKNHPGECALNSTHEHNQALQQNGHFSPADLEANQQGRYSEAQLKRLEAERDFIQQSAVKYDNKKTVIILIFGTAFILFLAVLYFVGIFDILQDVLKSAFLPVMLAALGAAIFMILVVIPHQYQSSVDAFKAMGAPVSPAELGAIQTIEARADAYKSQGGINRHGHQSPAISYILQLEGIKFRVSESLLNVIQAKRLYRVHAVNDQGVWVLLSMESLE